MGDNIHPDEADIPQWLKYFEGKSVTISFRLKFNQILLLENGDPITVSHKGDIFQLVKLHQ